MIELTFLNELIIIKRVHEDSVIFATIGVFLSKGLKFQPYVCNRCHNLLKISMKLKDFDYCCVIIGISKREAMKLLQNIDLTEQSGAF